MRRPRRGSRGAGHSRHLLSLSLTLTLLSMGGCGDPTPPPAKSSSPAKTSSPRIAGTASGSPAESAYPFVESARRLGLDFVHFNGMSGERYLSEMMGSGAAFLDFDGDGDLDVYLVQGAALGTDPPTPPPMDRLYRNDLTIGADGAPVPRFVDVTAESGIRAAGYGMGVATGDYDDDGRVDLYVTHFGDNRLWRNEGPDAHGHVTFRDVTEETGTGESRWSVAAAFFDADRDGRLDLYVGNYVDFRLESHRTCRSTTGIVDYCSPAAYRPLPDRLFMNRGDGSFEDVSGRVFAGSQPSAGLGVVTGDFDGDRRPDVYVANDGMANQLWIGEQGELQELALLYGAAVNEKGQPEAGMGLAADDFDRDLDLDLFVAHLAGETSTLYVNDGRGLFSDRTSETGLGGPTLATTGFGSGWIDYDNDGWLDLITVNGAVTLIESQASEGDPLPLRQRNQLFRSLGRNEHGLVTFTEVTESAGPAFEPSEVSRGAAFGDVDNDGDTDVLITNNHGPARLLLNAVGSARHWIGFRLVGGEGPRDLLGSRVTVTTGDRTRVRVSRTSGSYASAHDPRVLFGLGDVDRVEEVRIDWPDGSTEVWSEPAVDRYHTLHQGRSSSGPRPGSGLRPREDRSPRP